MPGGPKVRLAFLARIACYFQAPQNRMIPPRTNWSGRPLRHALGLAVVLVVSAQASATKAQGSEPQVERVAGPQIRFAETSIDFGKVESGQVVQHNFVFTNTGNQALEIRDVRPSCGCTTVPNWNRSVDPGGSGSIPFHFNSEGFSGDVVKTIIVVCNDPANTNVVLELKGRVWSTLDITPGMALFVSSSDTLTNQSRLLKIVNNRDEPLAVFEPMSASPVFEAQLRTNKAGKEYELEVALKQPAVLTNTTSSVTLRTSSPISPELKIKAQLIIRPALSVVPDRIALPVLPLTSDFKTSVTVRNQGTNALTLSDAVINSPGAHVEVREVQPGRLFILHLTFPAGLRLEQGQSLEARFRTSHPLFSEVRIPVAQRVSLAEVLQRSGDKDTESAREIKN